MTRKEHLDTFTAAEIIEMLDLKPHPEGGHFVETYRDENKVGTRAVGTAIYFLLQEREISAWHRIDASEIWHWYAGAPLELKISDANTATETVLLGNGIHFGQRPQIIVAPGSWQTARCLGKWTLAGCTVAPGFEFEKFEMAPEGWQPA